MRVQVDEDEDKVLKDGEFVRVPMTAMDAENQRALREKYSLHDGFGNPAGYKRGYVFSTDQQALARSAEAYRAYDERITSAWRGSKPATQDRPPAPEPTGNAVADARARYDNWLANRWRAQ